MSNRRSTIYGLRRSAGLAALLSLKLAAGLAFAQQAPPRDPAEPPPGKPQVKSLPRPASAIRRHSIDEKSMRTLIHSLVSCGTRLTLSSWSDPQRGIGCGRDGIGASMIDMAEVSGGRV